MISFYLAIIFTASDSVNIANDLVENEVENSNHDKGKNDKLDSVTSSSFLLFCSHFIVRDAGTEGRQCFRILRVLFKLMLSLGNASCLLNLYPRSHV